MYATNTIDAVHVNNSFDCQSIHRLHAETNAAEHDKKPAPSECVIHASCKANEFSLTAGRVSVDGRNDGASGRKIVTRLHLCLSAVA